MRWAHWACSLSTASSTEAGYQTEFATVLVEPCPATKGSALALSRVRAARKAARAQALKAQLEKCQGVRWSAQDFLLQPSKKKKFSLELTVHSNFDSCRQGWKFGVLQYGPPLGEAHQLVRPSLHPGGSRVR